MWSKLQLHKEAWKSQDFNWVWTRDLVIPVRPSNQLSFEAVVLRRWGSDTWKFGLSTELINQIFWAMKPLTDQLSYEATDHDHSLLYVKICSSIYEMYVIYHFTFILHRLLRTHKWPDPNVSGFIAQLVRVSHRFARSRVQTPLKSWLFQASTYMQLQIVFRTAKIIAYLISNSQFNIWNISYITSHCIFHQVLNLSG